MECLRPFNAYTYQEQAAKDYGGNNIMAELFFHSTGDEHLAPVSGQTAQEQKGRNNKPEGLVQLGRAFDTLQEKPCDQQGYEQETL